MPELPEVENTVRYLNERISGHSITAVRVAWPRIVDRPDVNEFALQLQGARITTCSRRGKFIIMHLNTGAFLLAHMRMSGSFDVVSGKAALSKHDHVVLFLSNKKEIRFHDPRKFGRFYLVNDRDEIVGHLGPEPLERTFRFPQMQKIFSNSKASSKATLLNQKLIAGIGNIYADEALWAAGIDPRKPANKIKADKIKRLVSELKRILRKAIVENGTDNGDGVVEGGAYTPKAYGRGGSPCSRCGTKLRRIVIVQRGTSFCPSCQR